MIIPICLASDRNYLQHLSATMASILKNKAPTDHIRFYILENAFTDSDRQILAQLKSIADCEIEYVQVKDKVIELFPLSKKDLVTIETYFRLFIPELIPNEDKIIYLDCDIIVRHSLAELYAMDPGDHYVLGVRDIDSRGNARRMGTTRYLNAGVLVMNSKKMREDGIYEKFIRYIIENKDTIVWHDQDVIAAVLEGHVGYISPVWNGQIGRLPDNMKYSRLHDARILHYIGDRKPWLPYKDATFAEEYFKYLRLTPFADYEKTYRKHRSLWHLSKVPATLAGLVFLKKTSRLRTYRTFRILGIPFKQKRKKRKKQ
ncbi:glycosyltransferase family 8 protein [Oxalobacter sp. OttesenSCG-928-P03]|nr:glycosyltransferase family 8 protein [Oxalobacter sp. OttesenSCG-928-P03]